MSSPASLPRLALIGISGYGRIHLQLAREARDRGEAVIVAAAVINPDEEAVNVAELRSHGCEVFADYRELLKRHAGRIDLCMIPTGIHWHARMTLAALAVGANVLVEKPLAASRAEVAAIENAERETGRFVAVGFQDYYDPAAMWLKTRLVGGEIGKIKSIRFLGIWPRSDNYYSRNNWVGRLQVDGTPVLDSPLNNAFAHFVMLSLFFGGDTAAAATGVTVESAELYRAQRIENFDTAAVISRAPSGARLWMGVSHSCGRTIEPEIVIEGTGGSAGWRYENEVWLQPAGGARQSFPMPATSVTRSVMMTTVLRRLKDPGAFICTVAAAANHTALIEDIHGATKAAVFPPDLVQWRAVDGARWPDVAGLEDALCTAFRDGVTLQAAGFNTALPRSAGGDR